MGKLSKTECFKIRLFTAKQEDDVFDLSNFNELYTIMCTQSEWNLHPLIIVADPFLFVHKNKLFLFYEEKFLHRPGIIKMINTTDLINWSEPITVLEESYHLSFPWVFEDDGYIYMIPESGADHSIRIYKANNDNLSSFTLETILLREENSDFADSSIIKKDGIYYLLTTVRRNNTNNLLLYYSQFLLRGYKKHPSSPIVIDNKYGRNAGSLLNINGKTYRLAQDCVMRYGDNVHVFVVDELSKYSYKEHIVVMDLFDKNNPFYNEGGHQYNMVRFKDKLIIATDAKEYHGFGMARIKDLIMKTMHK